MDNCKQRKQIEVSKEVRAKLAQIFNASRMTVWRALAFRGDSRQSRRIRKAALQNGGIMLVLSPALETIHDADNYFRQYISEDVFIEVNKSNGHAEIIKDGEVIKAWDNVSVRQLGFIQQEAASL